MVIPTLHSWIQNQDFRGITLHYWGNSMHIGDAIDWRMEFLLEGYKMLYDQTKDEQWKQYAQELIKRIKENYQDGHFANSRYEDNPGTKGTPHEASVALGLLRWGEYKLAREIIETLYKEQYKNGTLDDGTGLHVPNKTATFLQAAHLVGLEVDTELIESIKSLQCTGKGVHHGAVAQINAGKARYFPLYNARIAIALPEKEFVKDIVGFLQRSIKEDYAPLFYGAKGRASKAPTFIAGTAEILYALHLHDAWTKGAETLYQELVSYVRRYGFCSTFTKGKGIWRMNPWKNLGEVPCVGWNAMLFRLLAARNCHIEADPYKKMNAYHETSTGLQVGDVPFLVWNKKEKIEIDYNEVWL